MLVSLDISFLKNLEENKCVKYSNKFKYQKTFFYFCKKPSHKFNLFLFIFSVFAFNIQTISLIQLTLFMILVAICL